MFARPWLFILAAVVGCLPCACQRPAPAIETVTVLVAQQDIPACTRFDEPEKFFKQIQMAKGEAPKGAVTEFEDLKGRTISFPLFKDQTINQGAALKLLPGMKAIVIKVFLDSAPAGFIVPGSYVDVLDVVERGGKPEYALLSRRARVLATTTFEEPELTLLVKDDDAAKLTAATQTRKLTVTLCRPDGQAAEGATSPFDSDFQDVFVARVEIRQGTIIRDPDQFFKKVRVVKDFAPPSAIRDIDELKDKVVVRTLDERQIVLKADLHEESKLPKGMRAVTIKGMAGDVAAFILPGARVDLVGTFRDPKNPNQSQSRIVAQDLLVLAAEVMEPDKKDHKITNLMFTLAVKPEDSERISQFFADQPAYVVLRKPDDKK
jgi:Flp pilus assembly protein CpaB